MSDSTNGNGSTSLLRCPVCNAKVVVQRAGGEIVILQRALIVKMGHVFASCQQCKTEVLVEAMSYETRSLIVSNHESQVPERKEDLTIRSSVVKIPG